MLKPGGTMHVNVTKALVETYDEVAKVLKYHKAGIFLNSGYYAPFIPHYTKGDKMDFYGENPERSQYLQNYVFK